MRRPIPLYTVLVVLCLTFSSMASETVSSANENETAACKAEETYGQLPLYFIENQGQMDEEVAYYVKGSDKTLYFSSEGITFALTGKQGDETRRWAVKLDFENANTVTPMGADKQEAVFSYFKGKPEDWQTGIPTYSKLVYEDLWPGIDLVYSGTVNQLKYEFVVEPGSDPDQIRLAYRGASEISIKETGALKVETPVGSFEDGTPYAFQTVEGKQKEVSMQYACMEKQSDGSTVYGFDLGAYDPAKPLILDPVLLVYCGYIGGDYWDHGRGIAVDAEGCAYVTGETSSKESENFPVLVGPDLTYNGGGDVFVAKVDALGTNLVYCGYIGGEHGEWGLGITVDITGCAYVTGYTLSSESENFPVLVGPDLTHNGWDDTFVAKVNAQGTSLEYCGYIGGESHDIGSDIAVDEAGCAYVTGKTESDESSFPVLIGPDLTFNLGWPEAFVAKVNAQGTGLIYCGYIGGEWVDYGNGIAVDAEGCAYVTGDTVSDEDSFPVLVGPDLTYNGEGDTFVAKVNVRGTGLVYCGYIGGEWGEDDPDIAVDAEGCAYVTGITYSSEASFPVLVGPDLTFNWGWPDAFVAKVNTQGTGLVYCGYIGGEDEDYGHAIALDTAGCAYVTGFTESDESSFPVLVGPDLTYNDIGPFHNGDAFVAKVNAQGTELVYCGYIGGELKDYGRVIAVDAEGCAYVTGETSSDENSFPVAVGPDLTFNSSYGMGDAFVTKIAMALSLDSHTISASESCVVDFELYAGLENAGREHILLGCISGTSPGTALPGGHVVLPLNLDAFTHDLVLLINKASFVSFIGTMDAYGTSWAQLNSCKLRPEFIGIIMHYAYCLTEPYDYVSNPVQIEIVP